MLQLSKKKLFFFFALWHAGAKVAWKGLCGHIAYNRPFLREVFGARGEINPDKEMLLDDPTDLRILIPSK